jgi:hypothetical protein
MINRFRCYRSVRSSNYYYLDRGLLGRNGGHLIPNYFFSFLVRKDAYGEEEAKKVHEIEKYTETELLRIVREHNLGNIVDLSSGAHLMLFVTEKEEMDAKADYAAAEAAGLDVSEVEWLSKETMQAVSPLSPQDKICMYLASPGVRHILPWLPSPRTQPLATQTCDKPLQSRISAFDILTKTPHIYTSHCHHAVILFLHSNLVSLDSTRSRELLLRDPCHQRLRKPSPTPHAGPRGYHTDTGARHGASCGCTSCRTHQLIMVGE